MIRKTTLLITIGVSFLCRLSIADDFATVSIPNVAAIPGTTIDVPVDISPADSLYSYHLMVTYDPTVLNLTSMTPGSLIPSGWLFSSNTLGDSGTALASAYSPDGSDLGPSNVTGDILDLEFSVPGNVLPGSSTSITVSQDPYSELPLNGGNLTMTPTAPADSVNVVPEPSSLALLFASLLPVGLILRRTRRLG